MSAIWASVMIFWLQTAWYRVLPLQSCHLQPTQQTQSASTKHLPLSLIAIPWSWQFQYLGISAAVEDLPFPTTSPEFSSRTSTLSSVTRSQLQSLTPSISYLPYPQNQYKMGDSSTLLNFAAGLRCSFDPTGSQPLHSVPKETIPRRFHFSDTGLLLITVDC